MSEMSMFVWPLLCLERVPEYYEAFEFAFGLTRARAFDFVIAIAGSAVCISPDRGRVFRLTSDATLCGYCKRVSVFLSILHAHAHIACHVSGYISYADDMLVNAA